MRQADLRGTQRPGVGTGKRRQAGVSESVGASGLVLRAGDAAKDRTESGPSGLEPILTVRILNKQLVVSH